MTPCVVPRSEDVCTLIKRISDLTSSMFILDIIIRKCPEIKVLRAWNRRGGGFPYLLFEGSLCSFELFLTPRLLIGAGT